MAKVKLENLGTFNWVDDYIIVNVWDGVVVQSDGAFLISGWESKTWRETITELNSGLTYCEINIDDYEGVTIVVKGTGLEIREVTVPAGTILPYALGCFNKIQPTMSDFNPLSLTTTAYQFPYMSALQLPGFFDLGITNAPWLGGFTKRTTHKEKREGKDFVSYEGVYSTPLKYVRGWKYEIVIAEPRFTELDLFLHFSRGKWHAWINDSYGWGEVGEEYGTLLHASGDEREMYNHLDIYARDIVLLKKGDFNAV